MHARFVRFRRWNDDSVFLLLKLSALDVRAEGKGCITTRCMRADIPRVHFAFLPFHADCQCLRFLDEWRALEDVTNAEAARVTR